MARRPGLYPLDRAVPDPRLTPITYEADMGLGAVGALEDDEGAFARLREVGRLLDTVRIVDQLREIGTLDPGQLRDLGQWVEGGGLAGGQMQWPNAFWDSRQGAGALDDLGIRAGNLGPSETLGNAGSGFGMDWRDFDPSTGSAAEQSRGLGSLGLGGWDLVAQGGSVPGPELTHALFDKLVELNRAATELAHFVEQYPTSFNTLTPHVWAAARAVQIETWAVLSVLDDYHARDPGPDGVDPTMRRVAASLLARVRSPGINWRPTSPPVGPRLRSRPHPDQSPPSAVGPQIAVGGLADELRRPRHPQVQATGLDQDRLVSKLFGPDDRRGDPT